MSRAHALRAAALAILSVGVLLASLDLATPTYELDTARPDPRLVAWGTSFAVDVPPPDATGLQVVFGPQTRFSTGQALFVSRGTFADAPRILLALFRNPDGEREEMTVPRSGRLLFRHVNPFRAALELRPIVRGQAVEPPIRLEINVPDRSVESWRGSEKLASAEIHPTWARITLPPLLASAALGFLLLALVRLLALRAPAGPETAEQAVDGFLPARRRTTALALAVGGSVVLTAVLFGVTREMPGFGDEMNYLVEGRILASGRTWIAEPALPEFFRVGWMDLFGEDGKIWGFHPPGQSALLALGWLAGVRWLTLPLVFGASVAVTWLLGLRLFRSRVAAGAGTAAFVTSHWVLSLSSSYMAHPPSYLFLASGWLLALRFHDEGRERDLVFSGALFGAAFVTRPLSAFLGALVLVVFLVSRFRFSKWRAYVLGAAAGLAVSSLTFLYTGSITGKWTLPYMIKGPEAGQTLSVRLAKGPEFRETNLYRNLNELQSRAHSFGILMNTALVFVGAFAAGSRPGRLRALLAFAAFSVYVVLHSFLHWYGWMWEPRMLFDVSFLLFLLAGRGAAEILRSAGGSRLARGAVLVVGVGALGFTLFVDLPRRTKEEYKKYNDAPVGVRDEVRKRKLKDALVLFGGEKPYACYTPENTGGFDGPVVYARWRGELENYKLFERFPRRQVWYTEGGETLEPRENFYRRDRERLIADLERLRNYDVTIVVPWLRVAPSALVSTLPGRVVEGGEFLLSLGSLPVVGKPRLVVLVGGAAGMARLLDLSFEAEVLPALGYEGLMAFRVLGRPRPGSAERVPGLLMSCWEGTEWSGPVLDRRLVATPDLGPCAGEYRSISWETSVLLRSEQRLAFQLESDDGSGLFVDGKLVLDNGLDAQHGPTNVSGTVTLGPGPHEFLLKYFNGPGEERLTLTVDAGDGVRPFSVEALLPHSLLTLPREKIPRR